MENTTKGLITETEKMLAKIKEKRKSLKIVDSTKIEMVDNIDAYISDTSHFLEKNDMIRAFEAVVWAWAWIEILEELGVVKTE